MNYRTSKNSAVLPQQPLLRSSLFDHEKLEAYKCELEFLRWVTPLIDEAAKSATGRPREVCDQLDRASLSSLLNTAEGNGKRQRQIRARFFDDARGSATECAACLDALVAKGIVLPERIEDGKAMLLRIVSMLSGLVYRFDDSAQMHEEVVQYRAVPEVTYNSRKRKSKSKRRITTD
jgi:four helix bundle protein